MLHKRNWLRCLFSSAFGLAVGFTGHAAYASDPLPGDDVAPSENINIGMVYDQFSNASSFGQLHSSDNIKHNTRIVNNALTARYIRTFDVGGYEAGVQVYVPYVNFVGHQELGINSSASTFGQSAYAKLSAKSGLAQPNFSAFIWLINDPLRDNYLVVSPWISPPVSSFNKQDNLNPPAGNVWQYELEVGARTLLYGTPTTQNVAISLWGTGYLYGSNKNSAAVNSAVVIPAFGFQTQQSSFNASFHEQPSFELRAYLPYQFYPATRAFIAPGFYQSFGGKQTYNIAGGPKVDSGSRTNETQLRLVAATFISHSAQLLAQGEYDIAAHGAPLNRTIEMRLTFFF